MNSKQDKTKEAIKGYAPVILGLVITVGLTFIIKKQFRSEDYSIVTTVLLYTWLLSAGIICIKIISRQKTAQRLMTFCSVLLTLLAVEFFLNYVIGTYATYTEQIGMNYRSLYSSGYNNSYYFSYKPLSDYHRQQEEYSYTRKANSMGIFERELPVSDTSKIRILCMGDSYTEGVGVNFDSTWVKTAESYLQNARDTNVILINAGISGSDPVYEWMLYKLRLKSYSPQAVVLMTNTTDVQDLAVRGGWERFKQDSIVAYRQGPWWEPFYASSRVFRVAIHSLFRLNPYLISDSELKARFHVASKNLDDLFSDIYNYCRQNNIPFLLVKQPLKEEVMNAAYQYHDFKLLGKNIPKKNQLNLLDSFKKEQLITAGNYQTFYWKQDMHFNNSGYNICGKLIGQKLVELICLSSDTSFKSGPKVCRLLKK